MKTIFLFLLFAYSFSINAHILQEVNISQSGQNLHFEITMSDPYEMIDLGYTTNVTSNNIVIKLCQYITDLTHPTYIQKNIDIPINNGTSYSISIELYSSGVGQNCDYQTLSDSLNINVSTPLSNPITVGIDETNYLQKTISIYPNPFKRNLFISTNNIAIKIIEIEILDITGQSVGIYNDSTILNLNQLKKGLYIIKIYTNIGILQKKILKLE